ncbi:MAG TPA: serine/threonine-protein kinase, partial [Polyangiaceae bacterium]
MPSRSYVMYGAVAAGGMASVHLGKLLAPGRFTRRVAIKRLHPQLAADPEIAATFADEARHAARVSHVNVAAMLDVVSSEAELLLVMEYVHGESLSRLLITSRGSGVGVPIPTLVTVLCDVLHGLHAAHEATDEDGASLQLVHRDVSPQNVIVGVDGVARVVDFGIAKALARANVTRDGRAKGKMPYMAPEQLLHRAIDRRVDVYAAGVMLWEGLAGKRLFRGDDEAALFQEIVEGVIPPPSQANPAVPPALDAIALKALSRDPTRRYATAREMAQAIEATGPRAPASAVGEWVTTTASEALAKRAALISEMDRDSRPGETGGASVRAPSASVVFHDAGPPASQPAGIVWTEVARAGHTVTVPVGLAPRRMRKAAFIVGGAVLAIGLVFLFLRT